MSVPNTHYQPGPPAPDAPGTDAAHLSQPLYGASFGQAVARFFKKYATFSGRASRSEYWWVMLMNYAVGMILAVWMIASLVGSIDPYTEELTGYSFMIPFSLIMLYSLAILVPGLALLMRRLHDGGFSGWYIFLSFIPFVGGIAVVIFALLPSKPEGARFDDGAQQQYMSYPPYPQA